MHIKNCRLHMEYVTEGVMYYCSCAEETVRRKEWSQL